MITTTDWGLIEQEILTRLATLIPATVKQVTSAPSEEEADEVSKQFPSLVVVMQPVRTGKIVGAWDGIGFTVEAEGRWNVYQYGVSGKPDTTSRYGAGGIFAINVAQREKMNGFYPTSQLANSSSLHWGGCSSPEPYNSSGALKMSSVYTLEQLIKTVL